MTAELLLSVPNVIMPLKRCFHWEHERGERERQTDRNRQRQREKQPVPFGVETLTDFVSRQYVRNYIYFQFISTSRFLKNSMAQFWYWME